jgi:16S rRNA G527 N7-methylase RsmG
MSTHALGPVEAAAFAEPLVRAGLADAVVRGCQTHFSLLRRWNQTHNLTRITDPVEAAVRHYLDSALPVLHGPVPPAASADVSAGTASASAIGSASTSTPSLSASTPSRLPVSSFADIGSGAGFPGLVAALVQPGFQPVLVEPSRKRASFLRVAGGELGLARLQVQAPGAAEARDRFRWVLSRATFSERVRDELWPYVAPGGVLWAWTTLAEQSTWRELIVTWPDARLTWHEYELPSVGRRLIAIVERGS